jgi:hypothetical protein
LQQAGLEAAMPERTGLAEDEQRSVVLIDKSSNGSFCRKGR